MGLTTERTCKLVGLCSSFNPYDQMSIFNILYAMVYSKI